MWRIESCSLSRYEMKTEPTGIQGRQRVEESCDDPSWETVKGYVEKLDGRLCTEMSLETVSKPL